MTTPSRLPQPYGQGGGANLADILERVLDKGIVIAGDIRINLLDIELLTIKLRLIVASVDKAKEMGIDWWESDPALSSKARHKELARENAELRERLAALENGESLRAGRSAEPVVEGGVVDRGEPEALEPRSDEARPRATRSSETRPSETRTREGRTRESRSREAAPREPRPRESRSPEARSSEPRSSEPRSRREAPRGDAPARETRPRGRDRGEEET